MKPGFSLSLHALKRWLRKRSVVRQYDEADCGPAALLTVLRYHGGDASVARVRELAATNAHGTTLDGLSRAAEAIGFTASAVDATLEELETVPLPCIAHVLNEAGNGHFLVVYRISAGVLVGDPGTGRYTLDREEFERRWASRAALLLEPAENLLCEPPLHWMHWIAQYCRADSAWVLQTVFLGVLYTLLGLSTSLVLKVLVDDVLPRHQVRRLWFAAALLIVTHLARSSCGYVRQRFLNDIGVRVARRINEVFLERLFTLPATFFDSRAAGDITSRLADAVKVQSSLLRIVGSTFCDILILIGSAAMVVALDGTIGGLLVVAAILYISAVFPILRPLQHLQGRALQSYARVENAYLDTLGGIGTIAAYGAAPYFAARNIKLFTAFQERLHEAGHRQNAVAFVADALSGAILIGALMLAALHVASGSLKLGAMLAIYSFAATALPSATRLLDANVLIQNASVASTRLLDLLLARTERLDGAPFAMGDALELVNVTHAWPNSGDTLQNVSMSVRRGMVTALAGKSGSGKSTVVSLLTRRYAPSSGSVLIDGQPVESLELTSYRQHVVVVADNAKIFRDTLAGNVLLAAETPDGLALLNDFVQALGLQPFLDRFPRGLSTVLGDQGRAVSSGERQIIGLLRALVRRPSVLIVDEGLNGMDDTLRRMALWAIRDYSRTHAVLLVTHESESLAAADCLFQLSNGKIIRAGGHRDSGSDQPLALTHGFKPAVREPSSTQLTA